MEKNKLDLKEIYWKWVPNSTLHKIYFLGNSNSSMHISISVIDFGSDWFFISYSNYMHELKREKTWLCLYYMPEELLWIINSKEELLWIIKKEIYNKYEFIWEDKLDNFLKHNLI